MLYFECNYSLEKIYFISVAFIYSVYSHSRNIVLCDIFLFVVLFLLRHLHFLAGKYVVGGGFVSSQAT